MSVRLEAPSEFQYRTQGSKVYGLNLIILAKEEPPEPNDFQRGLYLRSDAIGWMAYHIKDLRGVATNLNIATVLRTRREYSALVSSSDFIVLPISITPSIRQSTGWPGDMTRAYNIPAVLPAANSGF